VREPPARPARAPHGYAFPKTSEGLLAWSEAEQQLVEALHYWLATTNPDGSPHVRPLWGVWIEGCFYFDGNPKTRWGRNLTRDPRASIHLEDAARVVIVDGTCEDVERTTPELGAAIAADWAAKYGRLVPDAATGGIFRLTPHRAHAWSENLQDATVWDLTGG
jgi:hypothetical protein